jgi:3-hydroxy-3-methylglutaryl CoA synthase
MHPIGIDDLSIYPSSCYLPMSDLVAARGGKDGEVVEDMLIDERSTNPPWEDPITLAVEAGRALLKRNDRSKITLLLVASESGPDQEKALSTWVQRYLDVPDSCRNVEVKHACYGGTASVRLACAWVQSQPDPEATALVICTDESRQHFHRPWEFVMGCGAAAMLIKRSPRFLEFDPGLSGVYTHEVSDLTRPTSRVEAGHSETSLLSYLEGANISFERYRQALLLSGGPDLNSVALFTEWLPHLVYHAPFGGITRRAHAALLRQVGAKSRCMAYEDFDHRVAPTLQFNRRMGGTYGSSVYISLAGLVQARGRAAEKARVGVYSYGSGSCAEFFSARFGQGAAEIVENARVKECLDARRKLSVREYEEAERERTAWVDSGDYVVSRDGLDGWYQKFYEGRGKLVFQGISDFVRQYAWS